jgi:PAS domain S-box-containing protein
MNSFTSLVLPRPHLRRVTWLFFTLWTLAIAASVVWNTHLLREAMFEAATADARSDFDMDVLYRHWAALHGGVYVPVTALTPPNPYLTNVVERDLVTPSGRRLTLMNPDYMTRQVHELETRELGRHSHITSLKPLRPEDAPDSWEAAGLRAFEQGRTEVNSRELLHGEPCLRLMKPLVAEAGCLKCHAARGHHAGELRGGISVTVPLDPYLDLARPRIARIILVHAGLWALGVLGILLGARQMRQRLDQQLQAEAALLESRQHLRELFDEAPVGYHELDEAGRIIQVNATELKMLGYSAAEMLGQPVWTFVEDSESSRQAVLAKLGGHTSSTQACERAYRCKDGTTLPMFIEDRMIKSPDGRVLCIRSTLQNVTERKRMEKVQSCLSQLAYKLSLLNNGRQAARTVADAALDLLGWDACFLQVRSPDLARVHYMFYMDTVEGRRVEVPGSPEPAPTEPMEERVMRDGAQIILRSSESDGTPGLTPFGDTGRRSASLLFVPLRYRGQHLGLFSIQSYQVGAYDRAALDLLQALADHAAGALERIRAEQEREKLTGELKAALANVKSLSGLLPICAGCKKIRDDQGYWSQVECYVQEHSEAKFTHGLCPDCVKKWYPELGEVGLGDSPKETS